MGPATTIHPPPATQLAPSEFALTSDATRCQPDRVRTIHCIIPCFDRASDLRALLEDLCRVTLPADTRLRVRVIDNASPTPLTLTGASPTLDATLDRLPTNTGGSGGFNAGLAHAIQTSDSPDDLLWLVDSDARLEPEALTALVSALDDSPDAVAAGSALVDPTTNTLFELGGAIDRRTGEFIQPLPSPLPANPIKVEYLAACSLLVRRWAAERAGLMCDVFLNADDVEWTMRLASQGRGPLLAVPASRARHPRPDRMRTLARYYASRNAFVALSGETAIGTHRIGPRTRAARALRETMRAISMHFIGRPDLAALHLAGLRDAGASGVRGPMPAPTSSRATQGAAIISPQSTQSLPQTIANLDGAITLAPSLSQETRNEVARAARWPVNTAPLNPPSLAGLARALWQCLSGTLPPNAVVSARGKSDDWILARKVISIDESTYTFVVTDRSPLSLLTSIATTALRGSLYATRLALRPPERPIVAAPPPTARPPTPHQPLTLSVVIVSFNRAQALETTLRAIAALPLSSADAPRPRPEIIVVDNASTDHSVDRVRALFPDVRLIALDHNTGVEAFNVGVRAAQSDLVLILDDDARPDALALRAAIEKLDSSPDLGAVALHPRHPTTHRSEWSFAENSTPRDDFAFMGCGNLVRRETWLRAGGYEPVFFLYRNDTDLALKLLASNHGVHFNPAWVVWHDSPAASRKSRRWFHLATRNWIWLARRHARGPTRWQAILMGWARAHQLAGRHLRDHLAILRGVMQGLVRPAPKLPTSAQSNAAHGHGMRLLLKQRK